MEHLTQEQITLANAAMTQKMNVIHHAYVDVTGDLIAGSLLGQCLYWFGAGKDGRSRARIVKEGHTWIAKARGDWWDEIRISPKQYDRAAKILKDKGFIELKTFKFNGNPTTHIRIIPAAINKAINEWKVNQVRAMVPAQPVPEPFVPDVLPDPPAAKPQEHHATPKASPTVAAVGYAPSGNNDIPQEFNPLYPFGEQRNNPDGNNDFHQSGISLTEITTPPTKEVTKKNTHTPTATPSEGVPDAYSVHLQTVNEIEKGFEEAWSFYPKKEGKQKARRPYEKAIRGMGTRKPDGEPWTHAEILAEVIMFRQYVLQRLDAGELERRYIPTGGAWFEGERWNDEIPSISSSFEDMYEGIDHNRKVSELRRCASAGVLDRLRELAAEMPY